MLAALIPEFVELIPEQLREGVLYISRRYRTASHLCCCGCKHEVLTPLNSAKWHMTEHTDGSVTLSPSIGNWHLPCRSHYLLIKNCVHWAEAFSDAQIAAAQRRDRLAVDQLANPPQPGVDDFIEAIWKVLVKGIKSWFRPK
jgi:hypothetical protein